jgi:hypothetical protein
VAQEYFAHLTKPIQLPPLKTPNLPAKLAHRRRGFFIARALDPWWRWADAERNHWLLGHAGSCQRCADHRDLVFPNCRITGG